MDFSWDNVKEKLFSAKESAGKYAKIAIDKTGNVVDITKLTFAKNDTENKINKLYSKIGEQVYNEYLAGIEFDGEIGETMAEIDKFKEELAEIDSKIVNLKSSVVCSNCGEHNLKTNEFCSKCGSKLNNEESDELSEAEDSIVDTIDEQQ